MSFKSGPLVQTLASLEKRHDCLTGKPGSSKILTKDISGSLVKIQALVAAIEQIESAAAVPAAAPAAAAPAAAPRANLSGPPELLANLRAALGRLDGSDSAQSEREMAKIETILEAIYTQVRASDLKMQLAGLGNAPAAESVLPPFEPNAKEIEALRAQLAAADGKKKFKICQRIKALNAGGAESLLDLADATTEIQGLRRQIASTSDPKAKFKLSQRIRALSNAWKAD